MLTPLHQILLIVLLEGFVTISAEILTIRQLIPFVGNSVVVTSVIIGIFLLFLAYGYRSGGRVRGEPARVLMRNFLISSFLLGLGLSYIFIFFWFYAFNFVLPRNDLIPLLFYLFIIIAPLVYLLGQTVPLTLHLHPEAKALKTGLLSGRILHLNTLGSFLGAVLTSVLLFNYLGVAWTVAINSLVLIVLAGVLSKGTIQRFNCLLTALVVLPLAYGMNVYIENVHFLKTNHYANYRVIPGKILEINHSASSKLDEEGRGHAYIESMKKVLFKDLGFQDKDILVLGAGGFTLSMNDQQGNRFIYVDIDPEIKEISQAHFSGPIHGSFIAQDARSYVQTTDQRFDAIVVDVYSSAITIPAHLITQEFFGSLTGVLKPQGVVLLNLIANPQFRDPFSRHADTTIRAALGFCTSQPEDSSDRLVNLVYVCYPDHRDKRGVYTDNLNPAPVDMFFMR